MRRFFLLLALLVGGCAADPDLLPPGLPCQPDGSTAALAAAAGGVSYEPAHMLCVQVHIAAADFAQLRQENRFGVPADEAADEAMAQLTNSCTASFSSLFRWYEAGVTIDGARLDRVGVRKKGLLGSIGGQARFKPSLKIKTDRVVPHQLLGDTERVTLNNNNQDPTRMRTCLAYAVFHAAGYPAPRCNLANVMVGPPGEAGTSLGAYVHVEPVKKRLLRRLFGDDPDEGDGGDLYEGALTDLTPAYAAGFPTNGAAGDLGRWQAKTGDTDRTGARLQALITALQAPDSGLLVALAPVLNVDRFITFWALEVLIGNRDGYAAMRNNFFLYFNPADDHRAIFMPWGTDNVFNDDGLSGDSSSGDAAQAELRPYVFAELPRRLSRLPAMRARFSAELRRLGEQVWDEAALLKLVDTFEAQVNTAQVDAGYAAEVEKLRRWIRGRGAAVARLAKTELPTGDAQAAGCATLPFGPLGDPAEGLALFTDLVFAW